MFGLLVLIALGAAFFFIVPSIIPPNYRSAATGNLARVVGVIFILFAVASTSFVFVPDGHVGHLFRVYGGGPLTGGRIIAADAAALQRRRHIDRVLDAPAIGRPRPIGARIGVAGDGAVGLGHQIGKPAVDQGLPAPRHLGRVGRFELERRGAVAHRVVVDRRDGGNVGRGRGADQEAHPRGDNAATPRLSRKKKRPGTSPGRLARGRPSCADQRRSPLSWSRNRNRLMKSR